MSSSSTNMKDCKIVEDLLGSFGDVKGRILDMQPLGINGKQSIGKNRKIKVVEFVYCV